MLKFYFVLVAFSACSVNGAGFGCIKSVGLNRGPRYGHVPVHVRHMHAWEPLCYLLQLLGESTKSSHAHVTQTGT